MGRNKFSPHRGPWDDHDWRGWWGEEPPFHTPVFVMTHHERPSFTLADTTFHFVSGAAKDVLQLALEAADGKDVRLGGGANTIRQFLDADLVDTLHVAVPPWSSVPDPGCGAPLMSSSTGITVTSYPAGAASSTTSPGGGDPLGRALPPTSCAGRSGASGGGSQRLPRASCSRSMASKSALKLPLPKPSEPCRSMSSKNTVGRSPSGLVKICSR
jgi:hypothetical protein